MLRPLTFILILLLSVASLVGDAPPRDAARQLDSPVQLGGRTETISFGEHVDLLLSPYVVATPDNVVTFTLATGDWRRLDEGVNVLSDFLPGTGLLYTNNNNGVDLNGRGSVGGGGSGPIEIAFDRGVRAVGLQAQTNVLGSETFTFSAYNGEAPLGTFTVSRVNGQDEAGDASFLGVRATANEVITRIVVSSMVVQADQTYTNDFSLGPVSYRAVSSRAGGS